MNILYYHFFHGTRYLGRCSSLLFTEPIKIGDKISTDVMTDYVGPAGATIVADKIIPGSFTRVVYQPLTWKA